MAQSTQIKWDSINRNYCVIDNSPAGASVIFNPGPPPTNNQTGIAPDGATKGFDNTFPGSLDHGTNPFPNGTIPDADVLPSPGIGLIIQKSGTSSTGSVSSLALAFTSNNIAGNTLIVACGVGNGAAPTVSDSQLNTYTRVAQVANGTAFGVAIFVAPNAKAGANTVTVTNGGAAASMAMEIYEVQGLLAVSSADASATNTSAAATSSPAITVTPTQINDFAVVAYGLGTAAQTITVGAPYINDSGQLNPTTPAGLFSFVSASLLSVSTASSPSATVGVAEPWAVASVLLKAATPATTASGFKVGSIYFKNPA